MIARGLHTLLMATVLSCPFLCGSGLCVCDDESCDAPVDCCHHCDASGCNEELPLGNDDRFPDDPHHPPCEDCQCLCGGAIRSSDIEHDHLHYGASAVDCLTGSAHTTGRSQFDRTIPGQCASVDGHGNSGRTLRERIMSMLC
jgi:hypothetical protein